MPITAPPPDFAHAALGEVMAWIDSERLPPVEQWHPAREGRIDIRIAADGRWVHEGGEMTRPAMVRLFSRILRREADGGYVLVTPAEKLAIMVEDAPLIAVEARAGEGGLLLRLNTDDVVPLDAAHPLRLRDGPAGRLPYLHVRGPAERPVEARLSRALFYELAEQADADGMIASAGARFPLGDPA
jgi:hypothetical protein